MFERFKTTYLISKVHFILNELVMGGMVLETNMTEIMLRIEEQNKLEKEEVTFTYFIFTRLLFYLLWIGLFNVSKLTRKF